MKILYLTARQPYPFMKGDQMLAYNQIKYLSMKHDIYLVSFYKENKADLVSELAPYCKKIYLFKDTLIKQLISSLKTIYNFKSIQANCFYRYGIRRAINSILREVQPDIVHVQSFRMAEYMMNIPINKSIDLIDAYSLNMKKRMLFEKNVIKKSIWMLEYRLLKNFEKKILMSYSKKFIVAKRDKLYLNDNAIVVNPLGVFLDDSLIEEARKQKNSIDYNIVFHGNLSYYPNVNAINFLVANVFPQLEVSNKKVKLYLVGGNPSEEIRNLSSEKIIITGYVKQIENYLGIADVAIYPIFDATGLQTKLLEAMFSKVPTIISVECSKGLEEAENYKNTLIANSTDEYVKLFNDLLNHELYKTISESGRKLVIDYYSWERHIQELEALWIREKIG